MLSFPILIFSNWSFCGLFFVLDLLQFVARFQMLFLCVVLMCGQHHAST